MNYTTSTATTTPTERQPVNIKALEDAMAAIPPEPFAEMMRLHGADPATHILVLPQSFHLALPPSFGADLSSLLPSYVRFSDLVTAPMLVMRAAIGLPIRPTF